MRKGQNPSKFGSAAYQPQVLGIAVVSYIPMMGGYFEHSLEILNYQIASIHHSTPAEFDLYVFDNGSCAEVQAELYRLHADGYIDFLFSSRHNLGKIGAINWILGSMPNELICYSDSDVLFRPGWFEHSLRILETFPRPGLISAQPCLDDVLRGAGNAHRILDNDSRYQIDQQAIDPKAIEEYAMGFGYPPERASEFKNTLYPVVTHLPTGTRAVVGATHVQFLMPRSVARDVVPLPATLGLSREEDLNLNRTVDQKGYLHLSTLEPYYYHMGNTPDELVINEVQHMKLQEVFQVPLQRERPARKGWGVRVLSRLSRIGPFRAVIYRFYKLLFEVYS
jgi:hypothetical protein